MGEPADRQPPTSDELLRASKLLAYALRHHPESLDLTLDPAGGWVDVQALVDAINHRRRLPFRLTQEDVDALARGPGRSRFELSGTRIRARFGHSVEGIEPGAAHPPDFLFVSLSPTDLSARAHGDEVDLAGLLFDEDEALHAPDALVVIEAARASRSGARFVPTPDGYQAERLPARHVLNLRPDYARLICAGGVLARTANGTVEVALIRTLPREQTQEPLEIADPRQAPDRRRNEDRRRNDGTPPATGERRRGRSRRLRRRRRNPAWSADGRLELPKGKVEPNEEIPAAAVREAREEMGIVTPLRVRAPLSKNHYAFRHPDGRWVFKTVHYFLLEADGEPVFEPQRTEGIVGVEWWSGERAVDLVAFPNLRPVLERALEVMAADPHE